ncbi:4'-phosphopantetheinyl transferase superfamily protein [Cryomorpha ignava]|uniref:4'-phosphopantetheinyl transferase superfamily protein n=1 Tax=Cryomorpha ignava TaxID=101383 RepID=A0A7K3WR78_9FLAO|nr:4'-phosphopantetheinyl transferase superfamily protein [Cryomorpha ignava]NEN23974.1 4'-phosphopantetheinyl transferase superfamily protein [Cryomorpha ignava]
MPLLYYRSLQNAEIALWKATEHSDFFRDNLKEQDFPTDQVEQIHHPEKIHQWYASRFLLCRIYPAAIQLYSQRKPYLFNGPEISFSHSQDVVAVQISHYKSGIDVQWADPKLKVISARFLNDMDMETVKTSDEIISLSIIWSIKEAVFKYYGTGLTFKHIEVKHYDPVSDTALAVANRNGEKQTHKLIVDYIDGMSLAYVIE